MPILVLVDIQKEYITKGRPFYLETIEESLNNLKKLLAHARQNKWKIFHMAHKQNADCFHYDSEFSEFIEDFEPIEGEVSFQKSDFSCFSSPEFLATIDRVRHEDIFLAGYGATMCCLCTLIDAHHRQYDFNFVTDATCAKRSARYGEQDMKEHIIDITSAFACNLVTTDDVLNWKQAELIT